MFFKINFTRLIHGWSNDEGGQNIEIKFILFHDLACDREMTEIVAICFIHYIILNSQRLCETNVNI